MFGAPASMIQTSPHTPSLRPCHQLTTANTTATAKVDLENADATHNLLNAWIDFNRDGDWLDAGEQVFVDQSVVNGPNALSLFVPSSASLGATLSTTA